MSNEISRIYTCEDEEMFIRAHTIQAQLDLDIALFTGEFDNITQTTSDNLKASIEAAEALSRDTEEKALLKVLTENVNAELGTARSALRKLNASAENAYPEKPASQRAFGQDNWKTAYSDQEKMDFALRQAHSVADKEPFKTDLAAEGFTSANNANLLIIADDLHAKNLLQENAKTSRTISTQDRIIQYNSVWKQLRKINIASQVVFENDPAKLNVYRLYASSAANTTVNIVLHSGSLAGAPVANATVTLTNTLLADQVSNDLGSVSFVSVNMPDLLNINVVTEGGEPTTFTNVDIVSGTTNDLEFAIG